MRTVVAASLWLLIAPSVAGAAPPAGGSPDDRHSCEAGDAASCAALFVSGAHLEPEREPGITLAECAAGDAKACRELADLVDLAAEEAAVRGGERPHRRVLGLTKRAAGALEGSRLDRAWDLADEAARATEADLGARHPALVPPLLVMGRVSSARGDEEAAVHHFGRAIAAALCGGEAARPGLADALSALGRAETRRGRRSSAANSLVWSVTVRETLRPRPNGLIIEDLEILMDVLLADGRQTAATRAAAKLAPYLRYMHIDDQVDYWCGVAEKGEAAGHLAFARRIAEDTYVLARDRDASPWGLGRSNLCLAEICATQADGERAVALAQEAADLLLEREDTLDADRVYLLYTLGSYELVYTDVIAARHHLGEALAIAEASRDTAVEDLADVLTALGLALMDELDPRFAAAQALLERALSLQEQAWGPNDSRLWFTRSQLGTLAFLRSDFLGANEHAVASYDLYRSTLGEGECVAPSAEAVLASSFRMLGQPEAVRENAVLALSSAERDLRASLDYASEAESIAMIQAHWTYLGLYLSSFDREEDHETAYATVLRWKGLVGRSLLRRHEAARLDVREGRGADGAGLEDARRTISDLALSERTRWSAEDRERLVSAIEAKEQIERDLGARISRRSGRDSAADASPADLCRALPGDTALVDFVRHTVFEPEAYQLGQHAPSHYTAFVTLGGDCDRPVRVDLGRADDIDASVEAYRRSLGVSTDIARGSPEMDRGARVRRASDPEDGEPEEQLVERLWAPLGAALGGRQRILVAPDGALHAVPFAGLRGADGRFLVQDHTFAVLADAQAILGQSAESGDRAAGALVLGGLDFDHASPATGDVAALETHESPPRSDPTGSRAWTCWERDFPPLPGTVDEGRALAGRLHDRFPGEDIVLLEGASATQARLERELPGRRLVHLATHGFFGTDRCAPPAETSPRSSVDEVRSHHPMVLSGLVLSGANEADMAYGDVTGYWTAEAIAGLDLEGTELVVLSACDTGLGEIRSGEGVMGLQRAFSFAGAEEVVMSLWSVPDDATRRLMGRFYDAYLDPDDPVTAAEALREAQLSLLAEGGGEDPRQWAGFVCAGRGR